jgi:hypothetical protein
MEKKRMYFGMSVDLPFDDAVEFRRSLRGWTKYYILKVRTNHNARNIDRRNRYVVVRHRHKNEKVEPEYAVWGTVDMIC